MNQRSRKVPKRCSVAFHGEVRTGNATTRRGVTLALKSGAGTADKNPSTVVGPPRRSYHRSDPARHQETTCPSSTFFPAKRR